MRGVEGKTGKHRLGFSYGLLALAVLLYLGVLAYSSYAAEWRAKAEVPKIDPVLQIIKGLRQYQKIKAAFPPSFKEVARSVRCVCDLSELCLPRRRWKHYRSRRVGLL